MTCSSPQERTTDPERVEHPTFQHLFCQRFGCTEATYERELLRRLYYPHARCVVPFLKLWRRHYFQPESIFARQLARTRTLAEVKLDVDFYNHKYVVDSVRRGMLNLRLSGARTLRLARDLFDQDPARQARG